MLRRFSLTSRRGRLVVAEHPDDLRHRDRESGGPNPLVSVGFELLLQLGDVGPGREVVVPVRAVLDRDDLGDLLGEQGERPSCVDHLIAA